MAARGGEFLNSISLAGLEFGGVGNSWRGTYGVDYYEPQDDDFEYAKSRLFNCVRIPVRWERCQPTLGGALDATYMGRIDSMLSKAKSRGMYMILDVHNYACYAPSGDPNERPIGGGTVTETHFVDLWDRLSLRYLNDSRIIFGLMNEPKGDPDISSETWWSAANAATAQIRANGHTGLLLVAGNGYSGVDGWMDADPAWYGTSNQVGALTYVDSANNFMFEGHTYWNQDGSGDYYGLQPAGDVYTTTKCTTVLSPWVTWLRTHGFRGYLGEWGVPDTARAKVSSVNWAREVSQHRDVLKGQCYWASGPWWGQYDEDPITMRPEGTSPTWVDDARIEFVRRLDFMPQPAPSKTSWSPAIDLPGVTYYYRTPFLGTDWYSHGLAEDGTLDSTLGTKPSTYGTGLGSSANQYPADFAADSFYASGLTHADHAATDSYSGWVLVRVGAIDTNDATILNNQAILSDDFQEFGLYLKNNGGGGAEEVYLHVYAGATDQFLAASIDVGSWNLVCWRIDNGAMSIKTNDTDGWQSQAYTGSWVPGNSYLLLGENGANTQNLVGRIAEVIHSTSVWLDADFVKAVTYANNRYNITLP